MYLHAHFFAYLVVCISEYVFCCWSFRNAVACFVACTDIAGVLLVATNLMSLIGNFFTLHPIDAVIDVSSSICVIHLSCPSSRSCEW